MCSAGLSLGSLRFLLRTAPRDRQPPTANRQPSPIANRHQPPAAANCHPSFNNAFVVLCLAQITPPPPLPPRWISASLIPCQARDLRAASAQEQDQTRNKEALATLSAETFSKLAHGCLPPALSGGEPQLLQLHARYAALAQSVQAWFAYLDVYPVHDAWVPLASSARRRFAEAAAQRYGVPAPEALVNAPDPSDGGAPGCPPPPPHMGGGQGCVRTAVHRRRRGDPPPPRTQPKHVRAHRGSE